MPMLMTRQHVQRHSTPTSYQHQSFISAVHSIIPFNVMRLLHAVYVKLFCSRQKSRYITHIHRHHKVAFSLYTNIYTKFTIHREIQFVQLLLVSQPQSFSSTAKICTKHRQTALALTALKPTGMSVILTGGIWTRAPVAISVGRGRRSAEGSSVPATRASASETISKGNVYLVYLLFLVFVTFTWAGTHPQDIPNNKENDTWTLIKYL
jgi:hypothetical protein